MSESQPQHPNPMWTQAPPEQSGTYALRDAVTHQVHAELAGLKAGQPTMPLFERWSVEGIHPDGVEPEPSMHEIHEGLAVNEAHESPAANENEE